MMNLKIDNPTIENYFHDTNTIQNVLEFIAINNITINSNSSLTQNLQEALEEVEEIILNNNPKNAKDFLNEL
jgi:hypothetical protein